MKNLKQLLDDLGIERAGVVHVGAHRGQEVPEYRSAGFGRIVLIEPEPRLAERLERKFTDCQVIRTAVGARRSQRRKFNVASQRKWSSLVDIPPDQSMTGERIETVDRIDVEVCILPDVQDGCNVAVVDTQGTEHDVLAAADLDTLDLVIVETVAPGPVWRPAWRRDEADAWFAERGWHAVHEFEHTAADVIDVAYAPAPPVEPEQTVEPEPDAEPLADPEPLEPTEVDDDAE